MKLMTRMLCLAFCATCLPAVATTWYVSATGGSDANDGMDWATAKASIQAAIDAAGDGDGIVVTNGTYGIFSSENKCVTINSVGGPLVTIVDGGGNYSRGNQMNFSGGNESTNIVVSGFTIQHLANINGGTFIGSVIRDNNCSSVGGGALNSAIAYNCLFLNNVGMNGAAGDGTIFKNCTMVGNRATSGYQGVTLNSVLENCIVYNNANNERQTWQYWFERCWLANWDHRDFNTYVGDPGFIDVANDDYRLSPDSPCVDAGDERYGVGRLDLCGNVRVSGLRVDIGAYECNQNDLNWIVVQYDLNYAGSVMISNRYVSGGSVGRFPTVTRSGYAFDGWYTAVIGGTVIDLGIPVDSCPAILYAHWTDYSAAQRAALDMTTDSSLGDNGSSVWVVDASTYHTGNSSLKSAAIGDSQSTYQTLTVHGTGSVSFWWKVSSESNYDHLRYYVDGVEQAAISGEVDWQQKTVTFSTEGEHVIKWQYSKDGSVSRGSDCGWIDGVEINMTGEHLPVSGRDIVLDLNGSAETNWVCRVEDGQPFGALPTPEWIGHRFIGWFTQADGGDAVSEETVVDSSCLKLYARWTSVCTIAFDVGGVATGSVECIFREIGNAIGELPKSTMTQDTGFILLGWFTLPEGGKMVTEKTVVLSDMTLYAHWAMAGEVSIVSCGVRETDATILDVIYRVNSTNATANVRALAFENGEESFSKVVRPETFVDDTGRNLGYMVPANTNLTLSWKVTDDWDVKLARVKFMILVEENFYPLSLDLVTIPANRSHRAVTFSTNEISSDEFRDALFWLYADHDEGLALENGVLSAGGVILANGAELVPAAAARYVFKTMGYSLLDGAELEYVNETARLNLKSEDTEQHAFKQD